MWLLQKLWSHFHFGQNYVLNMKIKLITVYVRNHHGFNRLIRRKDRVVRVYPLNIEVGVFGLKYPFQTTVPVYYM